MFCFVAQTTATGISLRVCAAEELKYYYKAIMKRNVSRSIVRQAVWFLLLAGATRCSGMYYGKYNSNNSYKDSGNTSLALEVCSDSVVVVTAMTIGCDSPYTFYYGNGAHRDSPVCDYGDKATLRVTFQVTDDLQDGDDEIYFTMATYDDKQNLMSSTYPESLCADYVGADCTKQGSYSFSYKIGKFPTPSGTDRTMFVPDVQMAFSTEGDSGFNLGAVNIECQSWDQDQPVYISWREPVTKSERMKDFFTNYGMLIGTGFALIGFMIFVWKQSGSVRSCSDPDFVSSVLSDPSKLGLASLV